MLLFCVSVICKKYLMMPCLTLEECIRLLGHIQAEVSPTKAAKASNVIRVAVYKIILKSKQQNSLKNRYCSFRPKFTDAQSDADIKYFRANAFKTARFEVCETRVKRKIPFGDDKLQLHLGHSTRLSP